MSEVLLFKMADLGLDADVLFAELSRSEIVEGMPAGSLVELELLLASGIHVGVQLLALVRVESTPRWRAMSVRMGV